MRAIRSYVIATASLAFAAGLAIWLQQGGALASRGEAEALGSEPGVELAAAAPDIGSVSLPAESTLDEAAMPAGPEASPPSTASLPVLGRERAPQGVAPVAFTLLEDVVEPLPIDPAMTCSAHLTGVARPGAVVELTLVAPCHAGTSAVIHHQGMMFSAAIGASGRVELRVPALAEWAVFMADLGAGEGTVTGLRVPDMAAYDRAVLQWRGVSGLGLHALEAGAASGEEGHVGAEPRPAEANGSLTSLGDRSIPDAYVAEIYSAPAAPRRPGDVALSVEAEILPETCGRLIEAQSIQAISGGLMRTLDLTMTVPGCEAVGEYLILSNMLQDLTLASR